LVSKEQLIIILSSDFDNPEDDLNLHRNEILKCRMYEKCLSHLGGLILTVLASFHGDE